MGHFRGGSSQSTLSKPIQSTNRLSSNEIRSFRSFFKHFASHSVARHSASIGQWNFAWTFSGRVEGFFSFLFEIFWWVNWWRRANDGPNIHLATCQWHCCCCCWTWRFDCAAQFWEILKRTLGNLPNGFALLLDGSKNERRIYTRMSFNNFRKGHQSNEIRNRKTDKSIIHYRLTRNRIASISVFDNLTGITESVNHAISGITLHSLITLNIQIFQWKSIKSSATVFTRSHSILHQQSSPFGAAAMRTKFSESEN